jgi:hypothetical protein
VFPGCGRLGAFAQNLLSAAWRWSTYLALVPEAGPECEALKLSRKPTLPGFAELCLVPYLFAMSHKLRVGGPFPFDELQHGTKGILIDYADLFGLKTPEQARYALQLLGMKKRRAKQVGHPGALDRGRPAHSGEIRSEN